MPRNTLEKIEKTMNNYCPLGFECIAEKSALSGRGDCCPNIHTCYAWTTAWELPYRREKNELKVNFLEAYNNLQEIEFSQNPITSQYDWRKYFAEYSFAEAVDLPYFFRVSNSTMMVFIDNDNICREEIQKAGYANAVTLPLHEREEYYCPDTDKSFYCWEVNLFFCGDEAINALNAGYADAIALLPVSLSEQRCFYE
jgi:hypothetical protein